MKTFACACLALFAAAIAAHADLVDFEAFADSELLTNQVPGLTFANTVVFTSGVSLNELEFPPHSGINVASDYFAPITLAFAPPVVSVGGYFTYVEPLTLSGFDASGHVVATATSLFSSNDALFGDPGSSPNEFIGIAFASGISSITAAADPNGGSFTLDDLTYQPQGGAPPVPEPSSVCLLLVVLACSFGVLRLTRN